MGSSDSQIYTSIPDQAALLCFTCDTICDCSVVAMNDASGVCICEV